MRVAAFQLPLSATDSPDVLQLIRAQVDSCERHAVEILCCPEAVLGGLADYASHPNDIAIEVENGELQSRLAPLTSDRVATIIGFTERGRDGRLFNSAAVFHRGVVSGVYRKLHPAINRSIYAAGDEWSVFTVGELTFGILICRDSTFHEPARTMASTGAAALFVPTNNGLPPDRAGPEVIADARRTDIARATETGMFVIRADVAGRSGHLTAHGSSEIVDPAGRVLRSSRPDEPGLLMAEIETVRRAGHPLS